MRWTILPLAVALAGCGPSVADDERLTCGSEGPIRVLEDAAVGYARYAGDRILAHTGSSFPLDPQSLELFAVGSCGEDPISITDLDLTAWPAYSAAGPHTLRAQEDGTLAWVDTFAREPSHPLISEAASCVLSVGDGLVAQSADGATAPIENATSSSTSLPKELTAECGASYCPEHRMGALGNEPATLGRVLCGVENTGDGGFGLMDCSLP